MPFLRMQGSLPRSIGVAVSGGVDSMAILDFLRASHDVTALFFNHGTQTSEEASWLVKKYCGVHEIKLFQGIITRQKHKEESQEEYWRNERYKFFREFDGNVVTAHHLDDCVETWIWSSLHGNSKIIPYENENVIRPFRLTRKAELRNWCVRRNIQWHEDYSNEDVRHVRNFIRHELVHKALVVNPGLHKTVAKKVTETWNELQ